MALLREANGSRYCVVEHDHLVGRSKGSDLVIDAIYVSSRHATIRWTERGWELRDLGSHNGTFLDGKLVRPGDARRLELGNRIAFGRLEQEWLVDDAEPPRPGVVAVDLPDERPLEGDVIGVPSAQNPLATVYQGADGRWMLERLDEPDSYLSNGDTFTVSGTRFRFTCPNLIFPTSTIDLPADISQARIFFAVSRDEEHVELTLELGLLRVELGSRTHNYMLLVLARHRLSDREQGHAPTSCGWVYQDVLMEELQVSTSQINLEVCRLRRQLSDMKVPGAAAVIERRSGTKQLRIGIEDIQIRIV